MTDNLTIQELPYRIRTELFSSSERRFLSYLMDKVTDKFLILPKLALGDLFRVSKPNENINFVQKLGGKSVDFVLCSRTTMDPVAAIELDDPTKTEHAVGSRLIDEICSSLGFPIYHIPENSQFDEINWDAILAEIENFEVDPSRGLKLESEFSPICPNCAITMVLRFDQDGPIKGHKYYGCLNFPECQVKIALEDR
ncbi:MAG TPA: DUF2726 domain-containing protein [Anaerolineales bacterium]|nr:DUF2726 domain-containing protein [Anaerolineales bacterium]